MIRVTPRLDLAALTGLNVSAQAAYLLTRMTGPSSPADIGAATGIAEADVLRLISELEALGAVTVERTATPQAQTANTGPDTADRIVTPAPAAQAGPVVRIQPRLSLLDMRGAKISAQAGFLMSRLTGPVEPSELPALTGLTAAQIEPLLGELAAAGAVTLIREAPPPTSTGGPRPARPAASRRLLDATAVFQGDPFAGTAPLLPVAWLDHIYRRGLDRQSMSIILRYADGQVWGLRIVDGFPASYLTNRPDESFRVGAILRQIAGLRDEAVSDALSEQKRTGEKVGAIFVRMGWLSPQEVDRGLVMQIKWVLRELLLLGPPVAAATGAGWPYPDAEPKRVWPAPWALEIARRNHARLAQQGWDAALAGLAVSARPAAAVHLERQMLTSEERKVADRFRGAHAKLGSPPTAEERTVFLAGLLEIAGESSKAKDPDWFRRSAAEPFALLGLHWSCLDDEVEDAHAARVAELNDLRPARAAEIRHNLDAARAALLGEESRRHHIAAAARAEQREQAAMLLVDQGVAELHARKDLEAARRIADRIERIAWDLPGPSAAACYILWRIATAHHEARTASRYRAKLEGLLQSTHGNADVFLFGAYFAEEIGDKKSALTLARKALAVNPYLREAKRFLGAS